MTNPETPGDHVMRKRGWRCGQFLLILLIGIGCSSTPANEPFRIVGYLPDYRFGGLDIEHASQLTDLILFAAEPTATGDIVLGKVEKAPWEKLARLQQLHQTRIHLCLGGWEKSDNFSKAVQSQTARTRMVFQLVEILTERQLNGLDIDWEYPRTEADWTGFTRFLQQLRIAFEPHKFRLTLTVSPWRSVPRQAWESVDGIQLMSYDYGQRHSRLAQAETDLQSFIDQGVPARKIVLGIPFYGRRIEDRKATTYATLVDRHHPEPDVDEVAGIFFNGRKTVAGKTQAAIQAGAGGVMIWEIGQDTRDETSLLRSISQTVNAELGSPQEIRW